MKINFKVWFFANCGKFKVMEISQTSLAILLFLLVKNKKKQNKKPTKEKFQAKDHKKQAEIDSNLIAKNYYYG